MSSALAPERWQRLRPLLERALDLSIEQRATLLQEVARDAPELLADLQRLLARHDEATGLDESAAEMLGEQLAVIAHDGEPVPAQHLGRRVGAFVLRRLIGSGGMGAVYEAERVDGGFRQRVAVKLIGGVHPGLHERFARERQILADLRHPNIAQLLDGGETADGLPYFALEYIEGRSLFEHADAVQAGLDARLALLVRVAEALAYAHRRHVIHRDIKPGNILVTPEGSVKLLDFGIAKILGNSGERSLTQQLIGPMTPDYAAPEQFRGEPLSVATDIYQFGVLMFHLLAERAPYRADGSDPLAFARAVCDEAPLSLDAALRSDPAPRAGVRSEGTTDRRRSERQRRADLDRILRRCLEKAPQARYPGMDALIADLEAVRADIAPRAYRRGRTRRRWGIALACAVLALIAIGVGSLPVERLPWADPWHYEPALRAFGLDRTHLHTSRDESEALIRQALMAEARGDLPGALAMLESVHNADPATPVPAMLLGYLGSARSDAATTRAWQQRAQERLRSVRDAELELLQNFFVTDIGGDHEEALRYAAASLELHPEAWFLRLARAHLLNLRGLRVAAVRELQQIAPARLGHRKLIDAIADRASMGDLAGAQAQLAGMQVDESDPSVAMLRARFAYTGGDLAGARELFQRAVDLSRDLARMDIEARALLYVGVLDGSLERYEQALPSLRAARQRLGARKQNYYAIDAALALAQIAALRNDVDEVRSQIDDARLLLEAEQPGQRDARIELFAARLLREAPGVPSDADEATRELLAAWSAWLAGDRTAALAAARHAQEQDIEATPFVEDFALLQRELGQTPPFLRAIDPPFGPYSRFAARWALGQGASVVPR